ncbi:hypothetical protein BPOR_1858g00010 [Botrytis porri]|uniref:Uncharacterized protein n=1 Tax=Botrytis porri TaxID=87229 RepID=A0A4Z1K8N3_9HELO|nr:hypothetical protein BPOR_1858g00010 [Botrytis porri]
MQTTFLIATFAVFGAIATPAPSFLGIEVIREDNVTLVREVPRSLNARSCTNCVHVGGECTIGKGNCYSSEHGSCTDCGNGRVICVDTSGGSCAAP